MEREKSPRKSNEHPKLKPDLDLDRGRIYIATPARARAAIRRCELDVSPANFVPRTNVSIAFSRREFDAVTKRLSANARQRSSFIVVDLFFVHLAEITLNTRRNLI